MSLTWLGCWGWGLGRGCSREGWVLGRLVRAMWGGGGMLQGSS